VLTSYIAKYATKAEQNAPAFPELLRSAAQSLDAASSAQLACQKFLNKMLGERTYSAQETAHLLLGIPLVRTSVIFQILDLGRDAQRELQPEQAKQGANAEQAEVERTPNVTGLSWIQRCAYNQIKNVNS
jgi:hypothetical protein